MKKKHSLAVLIAASLVFSCSQEESKISPTTSTALIDQSSWILGQWQNVSVEGEVYESWEKLNDSTYKGLSFFARGKDTLSKEILSLEQRGKDLFYVPTVNNQNDGKPVNFKLTSASENQLVFENPEHDFPQKITYTRITSDSIVAKISGMIENQERTEEFPMNRAKN
jgi:hypothetical protein